MEPKRTLTPQRLRDGGEPRDVGAGPRSGLPRSEDLRGPTREIFLGVTSVNECRYCKWLHTHWSMHEGVPLEEVDQILRFQMSALEAKSPAEAAAILFRPALRRASRPGRPGIDGHRGASTTAMRRWTKCSPASASSRSPTCSATPRHAFLGRAFEAVVGAAATPLALLMLLMAKFDRQIGIDDLSPWLRGRRASPNPEARE